MSAYYDLYQTPNPSPEDGEEKLLHARILPKGTIPADKFRVSQNNYNSNIKDR